MNKSMRLIQYIRNNLKTILPGSLIFILIDASSNYKNYLSYSHAQLQFDRFFYGQRFLMSTRFLYEQLLYRQ